MQVVTIVVEGQGPPQEQTWGNKNSLLEWPVALVKHSWISGQN